MPKGRREEVTHQKSVANMTALKQQKRISSINSDDEYVCIVFPMINVRITGGECPELCVSLARRIEILKWIK